MPATALPLAAKHIQAPLVAREALWELGVELQEEHHHVLADLASGEGGGGWFAWVQPVLVFQVSKTVTA